MHDKGSRLFYLSQAMKNDGREYACVYSCIISNVQEACELGKIGERRGCIAKNLRQF